MPRVSAAFFVTGGLFVLVGMLWGMGMGMSQNFQLAPAHAHLNLLGWVTMALYGTFYAFTVKANASKVAWTNYIVSTLGVLVMIPSLAAMLATGDKAFMPGVGIGSVLNALGLLIFLVAAVRELARRRGQQSSTTEAANPMRMAAE